MQFPHMVYYENTLSKTVLVFKDHREYVPVKPVVYFNDIVMHFASSYEGRVEAFKYITGACQKGAVLISEALSHLYFPLFSEKREDCIWINYGTLYHVHSKNENNSVVSFYDGCKIDVAVDIRIIKNQMKRCRQFMDHIHSYNDSHPLMDVLGVKK